MPVHVGNCARKRAHGHVTNNNIIRWQALYEISILKLLGTENGIYFSHVFCSFTIDYTVSVYMMTTLNSSTLRNLFT